MISAVSVIPPVFMARINDHGRWRVAHARRGTIHRRRDHYRSWSTRDRLLHDDARRRTPNDDVRQGRQRNTDMHIDTGLRCGRSSEQGRCEDREFLHTREKTKHSFRSFNVTAIFVRLFL